jgi:micrococcal nuclease
MQKIYQFDCIVLRVLDGDTIDVSADLGFNLTHKIRVRVKDFDAPEMKSKNLKEAELALVATEMAMRLLPIGAIVKITTHKDPAAYNRYEASILMIDGRDFAQVMKSLHLSKADV